MLKLNTTATSLLVATLAAGAVALGVEHYRMLQQAERKANVATAAAVPERGSVTRPTWAASAPGRVEPLGGEIRIGAEMPGKVAEVLVAMNDKVSAGDIMVRLVDSDPRTRLAGAHAEVAVRMRERDDDGAQPVTAVQRRRNPDADAGAKLATDRRAADDAAFKAGRVVFTAQQALDDLLIRNRRHGEVDRAAIDKARAVLVAARAKLGEEQAALSRITADPKLPLPTRLEASLATARTELILIETALERTRIRAPKDGTVLQVNTRAGETVSPSPEDILVVFGDVSGMQVRAEVEERDVASIRVGQAVVVRSDAFQGRDFTGKVRRVAQALGAPRLAGKGPRRPMEHEVLQVMIDLDGTPQLLPGMRVDVFFKPDETVRRTANDSVRAN